MTDCVLDNNRIIDTFEWPIAPNKSAVHYVILDNLFLKKIYTVERWVGAARKVIYTRHKK
jgi:hypothetical protein